ncbi:hypothetical protein EIN_251180 [Entamoeba invadens IP1]|uniref:Uncharacterized protein n=1 Tax=Entamoeba invadens IP1 TaxID=370355 RepID=A0A0A1UGK4_ENTIV|nr:hypothetical protein EIN_251180 [Entamoeba invadens IP1]ELP94974.1 hypothetical protein EIN_251180 [Entamoeba invadens IP1]|eukprot:XP_004261745.1 hypothetical protein EIN_251180 [Entamoeba invadens IP1]
MSTLQNFFISIVVRYTPSFKTIQKLTMVSKKCGEVVLFMKVNPFALSRQKANDPFDQFKKAEEFKKEVELYQNLQTVRVSGRLLSSCKNILEKYDNIFLTDSFSDQFSSCFWVLNKIVELNVFVREECFDVSRCKFLRVCRIEFQNVSCWENCFSDVGQKLKLLRIKFSPNSADFQFLEKLKQYERFEKIILQVLGGDMYYKELLSQLNVIKKEIHQNDEKNVIPKREVVVSCDCFCDTTVTLIPFERRWVLFDVSQHGFDVLLKQMFPVSVFLYNSDNSKTRVNLSSLDFLEQVVCNQNSIEIDFPQHLCPLKNSPFNAIRSDTDFSLYQSHHPGIVVIDEKKKTKSPKFEKVSIKTKTILVKNKNIDVQKNSVVESLSLINSQLKSVNVPSLKEIISDTQLPSLKTAKFTDLVVKNFHNFSSHDLECHTTLKHLQIENVKVDFLQFHPIKTLESVTLQNVECELLTLPKTTHFLTLVRFHNHNSKIDLEDCDLDTLQIHSCKSVTLILGSVNSLITSFSTIHFSDFPFQTVKSYHSDFPFDNFQRQNKGILPIVN